MVVQVQKGMWQGEHTSTLAPPWQFCYNVGAASPAPTRRPASAPHQGVLASESRLESPTATIQATPVRVGSGRSDPCRESVLSLPAPYTSQTGGSLTTYRRRRRWQVHSKA